MNTFKPYPELHIEAGDNHGEIIATVNGSNFGSTEDMQRMVECWNALRHIAFPANHVPAIAERCERLEQLRKEAWARVQELEAELAS